MQLPQDKLWRRLRTNTWVLLIVIPALLFPRISARVAHMQTTYSRSLHFFSFCLRVKHSETRAWNARQTHTNRECIRSLFLRTRRCPCARCISLLVGLFYHAITCCEWMQACNPPRSKFSPSCNEPFVTPRLRCTLLYSSLFFYHRAVSSPG